MKFAPHFSVADNFGGIPYELAPYDTSKIAVLPVPYDGTASYRPGARDGPRAIITASKFLELYDEELGRNFSDVGIYTLDELEPVNISKQMNQRVYEAAEKILTDGKSIVMLGGEHSLTSGAVRAYRERFPALSVLHIDAHGDLRDTLGEDKYAHACVARRIHEICPLVEAGIRSISEEEAVYIHANSIPVFYAADIMDSDSWMEQAIAKLSDQVYLTIDIDALDPSIMPSTGTPVPGGLQWYQILRFLKLLAAKKKVVGFDVMELAPQPGNVAPDFLAAKLVYKLIGYFFAGKA